MTQSKSPSERARVRRVPERGRYDRETIYAIVDEALSCHVGLVADGQPIVIPTIHFRIADELFIHGSAAGRLLEYGGAGAPLCVTMTLLDGIVLARSAFHHSMNYRSVVVLGRARLVADDAEKRRALDALVNRFSPRRAEMARAPNALELKATHALALPLSEASAKVRTGGPLDDTEDLALPVWAGVIPLELRALAPQVAEPIAPGAAVPPLGHPFEAAQ